MVSIKVALPADAAVMSGMITELAVFEEMENGPQLTVQQISDDLKAGHFGGLIAHDDDDKPVGYAIYYFAYSTEVGQYLYLEDVYVKEGSRRLNVGSKLFKQVCKDVYNYFGISECDLTVQHNEIIGFTLYHHAYSTWQGRYLFVRNFFVSDSDPSQKCGEAMWKCLCKIAKLENASRVVAEVKQSDETAIGVFSKLGLANTNETEDWLIYQLSENQINDAAQ